MNIKKFVIWLIVIIGAFGLGFIVFNFFIMPRIVGAGKDVVVPNLIGKPLVDAQKILLTQNFVLGETRDVFDTIFPQGSVVGQKPLAGSIVRTGRKINLLVSKGALMVKVPFLEQMSLDQGMRILASLGINPTTVESLRSTTTQVGKIIGIEPGPGSEIPIGSQLKLSVSSGLTGIFLMPMLVGFPINAAMDTIRNYGLTLGSIQQIPSDEPKGFVVIQYPEDGMRVRTGDTVQLIVSGKRR
jgi:serine/threonine-protein kinase